MPIANFTNETYFLIFCSFYEILHLGSKYNLSLLHKVDSVILEITLRQFKQKIINRLKSSFGDSEYHFKYTKL